jgi:hypothetical protein
MSEDFTCQITLTPTIYKILKERAKLERYSSRVYLDILLRDVFSKQIKALENDNENLF